MGNHSDTGELLEEAWEAPITEMRGVMGVVSLVDKHGNKIVLDNPTQIKDSAGRKVQFMKAKLSPPTGISLKQAEALMAKHNKRKNS